VIVAAAIISDLTNLLSSPVAFSIAAIGLFVSVFLLRQNDDEGGEAIDIEKMSLVDVNYAVSDYLLALEDENFAKENGGVNAILNELKSKHVDYELQFNSLDDEEE